LRKGKVAKFETRFWRNREAGGRWDEATRKTHADFWAKIKGRRSRKPKNSKPLLLFVGYACKGRSQPNRTSNLHLHDKMLPSGAIIMPYMPLCMFI